LIGDVGVEPHDVEGVDEEDPIYQFCRLPKGAYPVVEPLVDGLVWKRFAGKFPLQLLVVRHGRDAASK
jgi:hypothetical protein